MQISQLPFYLLSWLSYQDGIQIANTYTLSVWIGIFYEYKSITQLRFLLPNHWYSIRFMSFIIHHIKFCLCKKIPVLHYQQIFICHSCKTGILRKIWITILIPSIINAYFSTNCCISNVPVNSEIHSLPDTAFPRW